MIVLAILVSLAAITLPNLQRRFQRNELQEAGRMLQESLGELRQEALQSGRPLFVQFGWDSNRIRVFRDAAYLDSLPRASTDGQSMSGAGMSGAGMSGAGTETIGQGRFGTSGAAALNAPMAGVDNAGVLLQPWDVQEQRLETDAWFSSRRLTDGDSVASTSGSGPSSNAGAAARSGLSNDGLSNDGLSSDGLSSDSSGGSSGSSTAASDDLGPPPSGWSPPVAVLPDGRVQAIRLWLQLDRQWQCPILWRGATGQLEIGPIQRVREAASDSDSTAQVNL